MTRDEKIARAQELRAEGTSYRAIGDALGVTGNCVAKWLNPLRTREWNHAQNAKRHTAKLAWQHARDSSPEGRGVCAACGGPMGVGGVRGGAVRCAGCITAKKLDNWVRIEDMWAAGWTMPEIGASLGWSKGHLSMQMNRMRKAGRDLPYRYAVQDGRRAVA